MQPITVTVGPLSAANPALIVASQTPAAGQKLLLAPITLDTLRQVLITYTTGEAPGVTLKIEGLTQSNAPITEIVDIPTTGTTITAALDYMQINQITVGPVGFSGPMSVGTNDSAGSRWIRFEDWVPGLITIQATVKGTVNYTIQTTLDDPNSVFNPVPPPQVTWINSSDPNVVGATTTKASFFQYGPAFSRVFVNSITSGPGNSVTVTYLQHSATNE